MLSAQRINILGSMKSTPKAGRKLSFKSTLENWAEGMDYCAIPVPAKITDALGTKSAVLVMARVNASAPFKASLFPIGGGKHYIRVRKKVRKEANLNHHFFERIAKLLVAAKVVQAARGHRYVEGVNYGAF